MNEQETLEYNMMQQQQAGILSDTSTKQMQQQYFMEEKEKGMIAEQLSLADEIKRITLLLRGYHEEYDLETDQVKWVKPITTDLLNLTDYGVEWVLNTLSWYINKNTLLSFYDEKEILLKMHDFANAFEKTMFMNYKKIFNQPTIEECKEVLLKRVEKKAELRKFALELLGKTIDEDEMLLIKEGLFAQYEDKLEKELENIREFLSSDKTKGYLLLNRVVQDIVHSTYKRAYNGMERKTLREHIHVAETRGGVPVQQNKGGVFGWLKG